MAAAKTNPKNFLMLILLELNTTAFRPVDWERYRIIAHDTTVVINESSGPHVGIYKSYDIFGRGSGKKNL